MSELTQRIMDGDVSALQERIVQLTVEVQGAFKAGYNNGLSDGLTSDWYEDSWKAAYREWSPVSEGQK